MRTFLVIALIIVLLAIVGWIRFGRNNGNPTLEIDADKVKQDTTTIWDEGRQAFDSISSEEADEEATVGEKEETP
jgi:hypothetical protein